MEINNNVSFTRRKDNKPSTGQVIGGTLAGLTTTCIVTSPQQKIGNGCLNSMKLLHEKLSKDELKQVNKAAADMLETKGLTDKGVSILKVTDKNHKKVAELINKEFEKLLKRFPKNVKKVFIERMANQFEEGKNACYAAKSKTIIYSDKIALSAFHEAGHAMNANLSKVGKILQKSRGLTALSIPVMLVGLFKSKKSPDEEPKNMLDRSTTFIKENAGKLTFATFLPVLIEEGLASYKGNKFAKQVLNKDLAKKVACVNKFGFASYACMAVLTSLGIYAGIKVKDAIEKPKN